jgi:hypothetical protein
MRAWPRISVLVILCGCTGGNGAPPVDAGPTADGAPVDAAAMHDPDAHGVLDDGIAPAGALPGEALATSGDVALSVPSEGERIVRVDAQPSEHVTFFATFAPALASVVMDVLRWDGSSAVTLGTTDAGEGLRTLAVFDPTGPRTFWARVRSMEASAQNVTLTITRVPFEDAASCGADCDHLLQLPLTIDANVDGYAHTSSTVFRYQYGRRDMVMFVRHAGHAMRAAGLAPFVPEDLSQWDGMTPGTDVGAPRHASHQRGKDGDFSLYGLDGQAIWRSFCTVHDTADGRECIPGSANGMLDGLATARMIGDFYATGRVTMCFLDRELIPIVIAGAHRGVTMGLIDPALEPLYADGVHLQHWPTHDNHVHIRVSEVVGAALTFGALPPEPFEAP